MNNSYRFKRIVVKVGSNVLTRPDGTLDTTRMSALTDQLAALHRAGVEVILVSSGAVASGRNELKTQRKLDSVSARQLFSAVGQVKLINHYYELFREYGITCGQVLTTKENFSTRRHYLNQQHCMSVMLENGVIPIVNENDTVSVAEFGIGDNDTLSAIVATSVHADLLVLLSDIDGLYTADPHKNPDAARIELVPEITEEILRLADGKGSELGTGGMKTKLTAAQIVTKAGTDMIIANGAEVEKLYALLDGKSIGTRFLGKKADI